MGLGLVQSLVKATATNTGLAGSKVETVKMTKYAALCLAPMRQCAC